MVGSIEDIKLAVEGLHYESSRRYRVKAAGLTRFDNFGHCMDGALVGALLAESLDMPPLIMCMQMQRWIRRVGHAVTVLKTEEGFTSAGLSRHGSLRSRREVFRNPLDLAQSYDVAAKELGYSMRCMAVFDLSTFPHDWRGYQGNLPSITHHFLDRNPDCFQTL